MGIMNFEAVAIFCCLEGFTNSYSTHRVEAFLLMYPHWLYILWLYVSYLSVFTLRLRHLYHRRFGKYQIWKAQRKKQIWLPDPRRNIVNGAAVSPSGPPLCNRTLCANFHSSCLHLTLFVSIFYISDFRPRYYKNLYNM